MIKGRKWIACIMTVLFLLQSTVVLGEAPANTGQEPVFTGIRLDASGYRLEVDETRQAVVEAVYSDGSCYDITPVAALDMVNPQVATVGGSGKITGVYPGETLMMAEYAGKMVVAPVEVVLPGTPTEETPGVTPVVGGGNGELPDLVLAKVDWMPQNPVPGTRVTFRAEVMNIGKGPSKAGEPVKVSFELDGGTYWADVRIPSLLPGQSQTVVADEGLQGMYWDAVAGKHGINVRLDTEDAAEESNKGNNQTSMDMEVRHLPVNLTLGQSGNTALLQWDPIEGIGSYTIKRGVTPQQLLPYEAGVEDTRFEDPEATRGKTFYYSVTYQKDGVESFNSNTVVWGNELKKPTLYGKATGKKVRLHWAGSTGLAQYTVYRGTQSGGPYDVIARDLKQNSFTDPDNGLDGTYYYVVKTMGQNGGESRYSQEVCVDVSKKRNKKFDPKGDDDGDGLTNEEELVNGTDWELADTDEDGASDYEEVKVKKTNPIKDEKKQKKQGKFPIHINKDGSKKEPEGKNRSNAKKVKRQFKSESGRVVVDVQGYEDLEGAPLEAEEYEDAFLASLKGIVGDPVEITAGDATIGTADISIAYDEADLNGVNEEDLTLYWVDEANQELVPASNIRVDTQANVVTGTTTHFSTYILGSENMATKLGKVDIIFAVDQSIGMDEADGGNYQCRTGLVQKFIDNLDTLNGSTQDLRIGLVGFSDFVNIKSTPVADKVSLDMKLASLRQTIEATNMADVLWVMRDQFEKYQDSQTGDTGKKRKVIVLLTDGKDTVGNVDAGIVKIAQNLNRPSGSDFEDMYNHITIHTVGIGGNAEDGLLKQIAEATGGSFLFANNAAGMTGVELQNQVDTVYNKIIKSLYLQQKTYPFEIEEKVIGALTFSDQYKGVEYEEARNMITRTGTNLLTGNYVDQANDMHINSTAMDIDLVRTYNSYSGNEKTVLGNGWRINFDTSIKTLENAAKVTASWLNVRDPESGSVLTSVSRGTKVKYIPEVDGNGQPILDENGDIKYIKMWDEQNGWTWYLVEIPDGTMGWVCGDYLQGLQGVEVTYGSGTKTLFEEDPQNSTPERIGFTAPNGVYDKLWKANGFYYLETKDKVRYTYGVPAGDGIGRLEGIVASNSTGILINYTADGKYIDRVYDNVNHSLKFEYREEKLWKVTDNLGRYVEYTYDINDNLVAVKDLGGNKTTYSYYNSYGSDGNFNGSKLKQTTDANGHAAVKNDYDPFGRLVRQYDGNNYVKYHIYKDVFKDEDGKIIWKEDYTGEAPDEAKEFARYFIDEEGNESKVELNLIDYSPMLETDVNGDTVQHRYFIYQGSTNDNTWMDSDTGWFEITSNLHDQDPVYQALKRGGNRPTRQIIVDKKTYTTEYRYDARNNLCKVTQEIEDGNGALAKVSEVMEYDSFNNLVLKKGRDGKVIRYEYEQFTIPTDVNTYVQLKKVVDPMGNEIVYEYYPLSETIAFRGLVKSVTQHKVNAAGNLVSNFSKSGYEYNDGFNNRTKVVDALGHATVEQYDAVGRLKKITDAKQHTTQYEYDNMNSLVLEVDHLGSKKEIQYDGVGNPRFAIDKKGYTTEYRYDGKNQLVEVVNAKGYSTKYAYDGKGNKVKATDARGYAIRYGYDAFNRMVSMTDARGFTTYYQYDKNGNLEKVTDPRKIDTIYVYDRLGRKTREKKHYVYTDPATGGQQDVYLTVAKYKYNLDSSIDQVEDAQGKVTQYFYDEMGRATEVIDGYVPAFIATDGSINGPKDEYGVFVGNIRTSTQYNVYVDAATGKGYSTVVVTDPKNHATRREYNAKGLLTLVRDAKNVETTYTYDAVGNLETTRNGKGFVTTYEYNELNQLEKEIDPLTHAFETSYDANGNVEKTIDKKGNTTLYRYNELNQRVEEENALNKITKYQYDEAGNLKTVTNPCGNSIQYTYDGMNKLASETDGEGHTKYYEYNEVGQVVLETGRRVYQIADPHVYTIELEDGNLAFRVGTRYEYDWLGRLKRVFDAKNQQVDERWYDEVGNLTSQTDGNGNTTGYTYDALYRVRTVMHPGDASIPANTVRYEYDRNGNTTKETNSIGETTTYDYDELGRVKVTLQQKNLGDRMEEIRYSQDYDYNGNIYIKQCIRNQGQADETSSTTHYTYDKMDRLKTERITVGQVDCTTTYGYDFNGNLETTTDWMGRTYTNKYDALNRLEWKKDPNGTMVERLEYYDNGAQWKSYDALDHVTEYFYDKNNRLIRTLSPARYSTDQTYDEDGNIDSKEDGNGHITRYEYNENNHLVAVENALFERTLYTYDANGNMVAQTDGRGMVTIYRYNAANAVRARIDHGGIGNPAKTQTYQYDAGGNLVQMIDRNGAITTYEYYLNGLVRKQRVEKAGATPQEVSYTYDCDGNQLTITDATGTTARIYDELGRVTSKTSPHISTNDENTCFEYDILVTRADLVDGFVAETATDPKGNKTTKVYDKAGKLKYVLDGDITSTVKTTYNYYLDGRRENVTYPNGAKEEYTYYQDGRIKTLANKKADGSIMDSYTYHYDGARNLVFKDEYINGINKGRTAYTYDVLNRLETVTEPNDAKVTSYTYDAAGNRKTQTVRVGEQRTESIYHYNEQNRLDSVETKTNEVLTQVTGYGYDNNGNQLTTMVNGTFTTTNTYDLLNQMVSTEVGGKTIGHTYNGEGLRVTKTVTYTNDQGMLVSDTTKYLYEYDKVVLELDGNENEIGRNIYGTNLLMRSSQGQTLYYMYNGHADVTALIDAQGQVVASYYYDAFGNIQEQSGDVNNPYRYAGYQYDEETGLYYLNARMYDPTIARFLQQDTHTGHWDDPLSLNLYTYCANNPLIYTDPTGHCYECLVDNGLSPVQCKKVAAVRTWDLLNHLGNESGSLQKSKEDRIKDEEIWSSPTDRKHRSPYWSGWDQADEQNTNYILNLQYLLLFNDHIRANEEVEKVIRSYVLQGSVIPENVVRYLIKQYRKDEVINKLVKEEEYRRKVHKVKTVISLGLDLLPIVGNVKTAIELYHGKNLITGDKLTIYDYAFGGAGLAFGGFKYGSRGIKVLNGVDEFSDITKTLSRGNRAVEGTRGLEPVISASGKAEDIMFSGANLSTKQAKLLEQLPDFGSRAIVPKKMYSTSDLAALTAQTGDEFAMFTTGGRRMIIRGNPRSVPINTSAAEQLANQGWRWSAHSHPGISQTVLTASGGDRAVLSKFGNQVKSNIFNSVGRSQTFGKDFSDWLPGR